MGGVLPIAIKTSDRGLFVAGSHSHEELLLKLMTWNPRYILLKYCSKKKYHQLEVTNGGVLQELAPVKAYKISV